MSTPAIPQPDQFQYIKLPDGSYGKFSGSATDEQIKSAILKDFPQAFSQAQRPSAPSFGQQLSNAATPEVRQAFSDATSPDLHASDFLFPGLGRGVSALKATLGYLQNAGKQQAQTVGALGQAGVLTPGQTGAMSYPGNFLESTGRILGGMLEPKNAILGAASLVPALRPVVGGYMAISGGKDVLTGPQPGETGADTLERKLLGGSGIAAGLAAVRARTAGSRAGSQPESLKPVESPRNASPASQPTMQPGEQAPSRPLTIDELLQKVRSQIDQKYGPQPWGDTTRPGESPQYAYRVRNIGDQGIEARPHPTASTDLNEIQSYVGNRADLMNSPQEIVRVNLNKLAQNSYQIHSNSAKPNWVSFNQAVPESAIERVPMEGKLLLNFLRMSVNRAAAQGR